MHLRQTVCNYLKNIIDTEKWQRAEAKVSAMLMADSGGPWGWSRNSRIRTPSYKSEIPVSDEDKCNREKKAGRDRVGQWW